MQALPPQTINTSTAAMHSQVRQPEVGTNRAWRNVKTVLPGSSIQLMERDTAGRPAKAHVTGDDGHTETVRFDSEQRITSVENGAN